MQGLQDLAELFRTHSGLSVMPTAFEVSKNAADRYNASIGKLTGYDCQICHNRGWLAGVVNNDVRMIPCQCQRQRKAFDKFSKRYMNSNGTTDVAMATFKTNTDTAKMMQAAAQEYLANYRTKWLFIGGQSGSGKTLLSRAILTILEHNGIATRFMSWPPDVKDLKIAIIEEKGTYQKLINIYKTVSVLLIDDLFKSKVTDYDRGIAYEIIDERYRTGLSTIINSEKYLSEILAMDEALGGRIKEKSIVAIVGRDSRRNYRTGAIA